MSEFLGDLVGLFVASGKAELTAVATALGEPAAAGDPLALAERVGAVAAGLAEEGRFGERQADLAAAALARAGVEVPAEASLAELEAAVVRDLGRREGLDMVQALALAVARARAGKLARAAAMRLPPAMPDLARRAPAEAERAWPDLFSEARGWIRGGVGRAPFIAQLRQSIDEERRRMGRVNILVAGRTGVGKSTLVNTVFGREVAATGMGRPVTRDITWYEPPELPVRLCDTKGLEMQAFAETLAALEAEVERAAASGRAEDRIHILWLCIDEPGNRVQAGEEEVARLCARHGIPAIVVLTKAIGPAAFAAEVRRLLPDARHVVRVLAEPWDDRPAFGLDHLVRATEDVLPEAIRAAFDAAQQIDIARKRARSLAYAATAATAAAAAAAVPIPVADAAGVFAINVGMIAKIATAMGVPATEENLLTLGASMVGALAAAAGGRMIAGEVLKLIPGIGTIAGGAINAGIAASATYGLGYGFTEFLCRFHATEGHMPEGSELREGFQRFWAAWREKDKRPPAP